MKNKILFLILIFISILSFSKQKTRFINNCHIEEMWGNAHTLNIGCKSLETSKFYTFVLTPEKIYDSIEMDRNYKIYFITKKIGGNIQYRIVKAELLY